MNSLRNRLSTLVVWLLGGSLLAINYTASAVPTQQGRGVTEADLRTLIYGDNIPAFHVMPAVRGGDGPLVELNLTRENGGVASRIEGHWISNDELNFVQIRVIVYESHDDALEAGRDSARGNQIPYFEMRADSRIGEASWSPGLQGAIRIFVLGRAVVEVSAGRTNRYNRMTHDTDRISGLDAHHNEIADTLARGLEWAIRQRPELLAKDDKTVRQTLQTAATVASVKPGPGASALTFRSITWAPLSAFKQAGAVVKWDIKTNRATVSYQGRTLALRPFHDDATVSGRKLKLGATVLLGPDGPVVPLRKVAQELGIKLEFSAKTLRMG